MGAIGCRELALRKQLDSGNQLLDVLAGSLSTFQVRLKTPLLHDLPHAASKRAHSLGPFRYGGKDRESKIGEV